MDKLTINDNLIPIENAVNQIYANSSKILDGSFEGDHQTVIDCVEVNNLCCEAIRGKVKDIRKELED